MEKCTRIGCGATFDPSNNNAADCHFHPGAPLFHEGLKSYTCCKDTNKPVLSFDEFLKIPGCTTGSHSTEKSEVKAPVVTANAGDNTSSLQSTSATNTTDSGASTSASNPAAPAKPPSFKERPTTPNSATASSSAKQEEEQDPEGATIPAGAKCKRAGCKTVYQEGMERSSEECLYHPLPAIFHEGSKGYACCKRRVLEFDEFLKIEGCKTGKHCFVGSPKEKKDGEEELVQCRHDMFQTPTQVIASIFGKQADKEKSSVKFEEWTLQVDLRLPSSKRFTKTFDLFGPIDPEKSSYRILGTKVEVTLVKGDGRSWPSLEAPLGPQSVGKYGASQITFGVQGRTGTVGAKEMVYAGDVVAPTSRS